MYQNDPIIVIGAALLLIMILLVGIVIIVMRYQRRKTTLLQSQMQLQIDLKQNEIEKMQQLEKQRKRIFRDLHDNIGSSLAAAKLETDLIKLKGEDLAPELAQLENIISDSYQGLKRIVWYMNSTNDRLSNLSAYIHDFAVGFFEPSAVDLSFNSSLAQDHRYISALQRRDTLSIIKELCHNIIKHSQATQVSIDISADENRLITVVQDNGIGLNGAITGSNSNGLQSIRERVDENNGELSVKSEGGLRTEFSIVLHRLEV